MEMQTPTIATIRQEAQRQTTKPQCPGPDLASSPLSYCSSQALPNGWRYSLLHRVDDGSLDEDAIVNANPLFQQKLGFRPNEFVIVLPGHQQGWLLIGHVFDEQEIGAGRKGSAGNYV